MKKIICAALVTISASAQADVLFFDMNGNNSSIQQVQANKKPGEKVIVIPGPGQFLGLSNIDQYLSKISPQLKKPVTIVMSGHDGGGSFSGKRGDISRAELAVVKDKYPDLFNSVDSIILRGCYSAVVSEVDKSNTSNWRNLFPNIKVMAGYEDAADSSERAQSKSFVAQAMKFINASRNKNLKVNLKKFFDEIPLINSMTPAFYQCDEDQYYSRYMKNEGLGPMTLDSLTKICESHGGDIQNAKNIIEGYNSAQAGRENPPADHHHSELRDAYSLMKKYEYCETIYGDLTWTSAQAIRLIYHDYIMENFTRIYNPKGHLAELEKMTDVSPDNYKWLRDTMTKMPKITRAELLRVGHVLAPLRNKQSKASIPLRKFSANVEHLSQSIDVVPFSWVASTKSTAKLPEWEDYEEPEVQ